MSINFLEGGIGKKDYSKVEGGDVVILPAFGATIQEMQLLDKKYVWNYVPLRYTFILFSPRIYK